MTLLGDIRAIVAGHTSSPGRKVTYGRVERVDGWAAYQSGTAGERPSPAVPGSSYFSWYVQEMWLRAERTWLAHYTPLAYSSVKLDFGGTRLELPRILGKPQSAAPEPIDSDGWLPLNYEMTPILPYNGGTVELGVALVGVETRNGLDQLVAAVQALGTALFVPQLSAVASLARPIADAVSALTGTAAAQQFQLGMHQTFARGGQEELVPGHYLLAVADAPLDCDRYRVKDGRLVSDAAPDRLVTDFDYLLLRLQTSTERDDLASLRNIFDLVEQAETIASEETLGRARDLVRAAKIAAWQSDDLTTADRRRVPRSIDERFTSFLQTQGIVGGGAAYEPLNADAGILDHVRRTSIDAALAMSPADIEGIVFR